MDHITILIILRQNCIRILQNWQNWIRILQGWQNCIKSVQNWQHLCMLSTQNCAYVRNIKGKILLMWDISKAKFSLCEKLQKQNFAYVRNCEGKVLLSRIKILLTFHSKKSIKKMARISLQTCCRVIIKLPIS